MVVRIAHTQTSPERTDEVVQIVTTRLVPALQGLDGFRGAIFLGNRETGAGLGATFWENQATLEASEQALRPLRDQAQPTTQVTRVDRYEVRAQGGEPISDFEGAGRFARVTLTQLPPAKAESVAQFAIDAMPEVQRRPGFVSEFLFLDAAAGKGGAIVLYRDQQALMESEPAARKLHDAGKQMGATEVTLDNFEVVQLAGAGTRAGAGRQPGGARP